MAFNRDILKKEVKDRLGSDYTPIELSDDALNGIIAQTVRIFSRYKPLIRHENFTASVPGVNTFELPADVTGIKLVELMPGIAGALNNGLALENALLSGVPMYIGTGTDVTIDISYLHYRRLWLKQVSRELASDPDTAYVKDPVTGIWTVYAFCTAPCWLDVTCTIEHDENLTNLEHDWTWWFVEYVIAESKKTIGEARSKFDSIPVAGGRMSMNGAAMKQEAEAKIAQLINDIQGSRVDMFPRWA